MTYSQMRKCYTSDSHSQSVAMDYKTRYPQPFTLAEATALDLSVISEGRVVNLNLKDDAIGS